VHACVCVVGVVGVWDGGGVCVWGGGRDNQEGWYACMAVGGRRYGCVCVFWGIVKGVSGEQIG
jgi:hypothetical protein